MNQSIRIQTQQKYFEIVQIQCELLIEIDFEWVCSRFDVIDFIRIIMELRYFLASSHIIIELNETIHCFLKKIHTALTFTCATKGAFRISPN